MQNQLPAAAPPSSTRQFFQSSTERVLPYAAALGSDFDGSVEVPWDTSQLAVITQELIDRRYSDEDIAKIMGGNTLRVLREVLPE